MIKDINMAHVMFPDWSERKGKPTGMHSSRWCPERVVAVTNAPNELGIWEGSIQLNCETKPSSFFPDHWNEKMIVDKVIESFFHIKDVHSTIDALRIEGLTSEGMKIKIVLVNIGLISTTFPIMD